MAGRTATAVKAKSKAQSNVGSKSNDAAPTPNEGEDHSTQPTPVAPKARRRSKTQTRTCIYWAVFNQDLKRVAVFEFAQKAEAEKRAAKLSANSGEDHFIQKLKANVPAS